MNLLLLLISHYIGDFILQSRKIATTKSSKLSSLFIHLTIIYCSLIPITLYLKVSLFIPLLYCTLHGIQDWFIWKGYKIIHSIQLRTAYYEDHLFYSTIGFDQLLHTIILLYLYQFFSI